MGPAAGVVGMYASGRFWNEMFGGKYKWYGTDVEFVQVKVMRDSLLQSNDTGKR